MKLVLLPLLFAIFFNASFQSWNYGFANTEFASSEIHRDFLSSIPETDVKSFWIFFKIITQQLS